VDIDRERAGSEPSARAHTPRPGSSTTARLETLRRVTRDMTSAQELHTLLGSITSALVEHAHAAVARVALYQSDEECDICRTRGPTGMLKSGGARCLHHAATAGEEFDVAGPYHLIPLTVPSLPGKVARERRPWLTNDLLRELPEVTAEEQAALRERGIVALGAYPLEFRGELLGVLGMVSAQPFEAREFELLGIFADQAAMAIKSAQLFRELERYAKRLQVENAYLREQIRTRAGAGGDRGREPGAQGDDPSGEASRGGRDLGSPHRRDGYREGVDRARDSQSEPAQGSPARQGELRGDPAGRGRE
jgi:GAF domain-containing protein